ncbi:uncharacterized WD repeat-containing protein C2A9.03-like [Hibiscus syriacus]|uniref:uncharacterized WD repeat-containing protein C2A9.03-like n=1 Tax=Hibiscus syriacus TaxID=106335 RepID=UPI0019250113|nr:uncharacterized WD repeat-containing protein C2A9.03-like [Hibiscus syriacus]
MSNQQAEGFYYMAGDFVDDMDEDNYGSAGGDIDADEYDMLTRANDTSSAQARKGKDIQGIPWERLSMTREKYRLTRLEQYKNWNASKLCLQPCCKICRFLTFLLLQHLDRKGVTFCTRTTYDDNAIMNAIEIYVSLRGGIHFMTSNNDCSSREYDTERLQLLNHFRFPWPVNHTSVSSDRKRITVVGDHLDGLLVDPQNGKTIATVVGHRDYSFASAWHPNGRIFVTGNQDKTCRVWDIRNLTSPVATLRGNLGAVRSIRFSSDGQFMVVAEPADFVHVYNTKSNYAARQEIDFFGEISGVSLSPDDESLYIGIWDGIYASLVQYNKIHSYGYLDSYL